LKPRITGVVERDQYRIEKVIFESRPNFLVTANLYVPKGRDFPLPGVVGTCGHSTNGKAAGVYQSFAQGLARQGYVVLIFDPIGQGERLQYVNESLESEVGVGVREHLLGGNQQFLVGESFAAWRVWDGIRALDYLLTREEVDPTRVGVTGNSGGGTVTTWLAGIEDRFTMAAPGCFVTTFRRNLENELPADTEQCPPGALALGLDHSDFLAAMAPKPVIILSKEKDYFDVRGADQAYRRLQHLYSLLGAEDDVDFFVGPTTHGYTQENREAMYRWFNRVTGVSDARVEPELVIEEDATLQVTPNGQVAELGSRPIYEFTAAKSRALAQLRPADLDLPRIQSLVRESLRLTETEKVPAPYYRILRNWSSRSYPRPHWTSYVIETEPGISAVVYRVADERLLSRPHAESKPAVLYVSDLSSDAELREEPLLAELSEADPEAVLYTVDVRGVGESRPDTCDEDSYSSAYGSDYFYSIHSIMMDRPYPGQKTYDVLRVLDWLGSIGHTEVHLVGKGRGALLATFAAVLSDRVTKVTLKDAPASYSAIAESRRYDWPLSMFVPDVLEFFDLPDCYRVLESKQIRHVARRSRP
jgi:cephalosporin-C deacetylase-like acetyl esterase